MRDRREVLKLLAGGTAVAAGATLITTSTAFAAGGTTSCRPSNGGNLPAVSLGTTTAARVGSTTAAQITINNGSNLAITAATCQTCHPGVTPSQLQQYLWSLESVTANGGATVSGTYGFFAASTGGTAITSFQSGPVPATIYLRRTDTTNFPGLSNNSSLDFTVRLTIRWVCQNLFGGRTRSAWRCRSYTMVVRYFRTTGTASIDIALISGPTESDEGTQCETGISA